ncbi:MAG: hypothetical protein MUF87_19315 [Anaerolineae bacterium]|jgi:hypothetical protein|nr:hypothetical protein [Anaerolineae bacterium]
MDKKKSSKVVAPKTIQVLETRHAVRLRLYQHDQQRLNLTHLTIFGLFVLALLLPVLFATQPVLICLGIGIIFALVMLCVVVFTRVYFPGQTIEIQQAQLHRLNHWTGHIDFSAMLTEIDRIVIRASTQADRLDLFLILPDQPPLRLLEAISLEQARYLRWKLSAILHRENLFMDE